MNVSVARDSRTGRSFRACLLTILTAAGVGAEPVHVGSRLELLVDDSLIERRTGKADLRLHAPTPREVGLVTDRPWEGNATNYVTVFRDGSLYRMYYRGADGRYTADGYRDAHRDVSCYAESNDGVRWTRPDLGLFEWGGSKKNNIVWDGVGSHNFTPFRDANPACRPEARYKALGSHGGGKHGLYAFGSADAIHWSLLSKEPVLTRGAFDSQNLAFWDPVRGEYREYHRDFRDGRDIRTATSKDFLTWTEPAFLEYPAGRQGELYTNQVLPYYRAPHLFLGFPTRYIDRGWTESAAALPRPDYRRLRGARSPREATALTEALFMTSRDGKTFHVCPEAFLRPGLRTTDNWFYGDNYQNWGLVETKSSLADAPDEISVYVTERTMQDRPAVLRRHTLRVDGFVSAHAPMSGGEVITRPLVFQGKHLTLNVATSAAGSVRVEIQTAEGKPIDGFALTDGAEIYGDALSRPVAWKRGGDLGKLAGTPVRLRFALKDADLYAFRFQDAPG
jgi:hypothetical protein